MTELPQALAKSGYVQVKLFYTTAKPTTESGLFLAQSLRVRPPYLGVVYVLRPCAKAYTLLEAYQDTFEALRDAQVVPQDAQLSAFELETGTPVEVLGYVVD